MKSISKYLIASVCLLMCVFTSCDDDINREASPVTNPDATNVYFSKDNSASPILGLSDTEFTVTICREKADKAQTVKLTAITIYDAIFTVPQSVSFAAGESEVDITIQAKDMELMKLYSLVLQIEHDQTLPYEDQDVYSRIELNVSQEDFLPYAEGTYQSPFFSASWPATLEYSEATDYYRFKDCWEEGYNVLFTWDGSANVNIVGAKSGSNVVVTTGVVDSRYGMISAYYAGASYDTGTKKFTFDITWRVSAGSFGANADYYTITSLH